MCSILRIELFQQEVYRVHSQNKLVCQGHLCQCISICCTHVLRFLHG